MLEAVVDEDRGLGFITTLDSYGELTPSLNVVDTVAGKLVRTITLGKQPSPIALDATSGRVYAVHSYQDAPDTVTVLDERSGAIIRTAPLESLLTVQVAVASGAGRIFVVGRGNGILDVLDAVSGQRLRSVPVPVVDEPPTPPTAVLAVDERAGHVFVAGGGDAAGRGLVSILDARSGAPLRTIRVGTYARAVAVDPRTGHVFVLDDHAAMLSTLDTSSGAVLRTVGVPRGTGQPGQFGQLVADATAGHVYVDGGGTNRVAMIDAATGALVRTVALPGHDDQERVFYVNAIDKRTGRVFVLSEGAPTRAADASPPYYLDVLDAHSGVILRIITLGAASNFPSTPYALDARHGRALVQNSDKTLRLVDISCV